MIDTTIELNRMQVALRMEWVELMYTQNNDVDQAVKEMLELQKQPEW